MVKSSVGYFSLVHRMKSLWAGILGSWFSLCLILHMYARVYRAEELEGQCQLWVLTHLETHIKRAVVISQSFLGAFWVFYLPCVFVARMSQWMGGRGIDSCCGTLPAPVALKMQVELTVPQGLSTFWFAQPVVFPVSSAAPREFTKRPQGLWVILLMAADCTRGKLLEFEASCFVYAWGNF